MDGTLPELDLLGLACESSWLSHGDFAPACARHRDRRAGAARPSVAPVYVRHEIVHNRHVVDSLKAKGARFVEELSEVPAGAVTIFSAHGVARAVEEEAERRGLQRDRRHLPAGHQGAQPGQALCARGPRTHPDRPRRPSRGRRHQGPHSARRCIWCRPKTTSTSCDPARHAGRLCHPDDAERRRYPRRSSRRSRRKFSDVVGPDTRDICYATQNRQSAVRELCKLVDVLLVVGAEQLIQFQPAARDRRRQRHSELSDRGRQRVASRNGCAAPRWSASPPGPRRPRTLVENVIDALAALGPVEIRPWPAASRISSSSCRRLTDRTPKLQPSRSWLPASIAGQQIVGI